MINRLKSRILSQLTKRGIDLCVSRIPTICQKNDDLVLVNIGAGDWECGGWVNLDYSSEWYSKVQRKHAFKEYDVRNDSIPYDNDTVDAMYCSHVIEHIEDEYVQKMLTECYRTLKPGGVLRIACPNAELLWYVTLLGKDYWVWRKRWCEAMGIDYDKLRPVDLLVRELATPRMINYGYIYDTDKGYKDYIDEYNDMSMTDFFEFITEDLSFNKDHVGDHINYWTYEKIREMLIDAGFNHVIRSTYAGSISPYMKSRSFFDTTEPQMSLYVETIKE